MKNLDLLIEELIITYYTQWKKNMLSMEDMSEENLNRIKREIRKKIEEKERSWFINV